MPRRNSPATAVVHAADLDGHSVSYRLTRHVGQRRIRMWATPDGLRVTAPRRASGAQIERALRANSRWLRQQIDDWAPAPVPSDGDTIPLGDARLVVRLVGSGRSGLDRAAGVVRLPEGLEGAGRLAALERIYRREARSVFGALCARHGAALGAQPARVRITDPRSRWGSCSSTGTVSLSWRLAMAPSIVASSLCAHEVVHLLVPNHSRAFRDHLERLVPEVAACEAWLSWHGRALLRGPLAAAAAPSLPAAAPADRQPISRSL